MLTVYSKAKAGLGLMNFTTSFNNRTFSYQRSYLNEPIWKCLKWWSHVLVFFFFSGKKDQVLHHWLFSLTSLTLEYSYYKWSNSWYCLCKQKLWNRTYLYSVHFKYRQATLPSPILCSTSALVSVELEVAILMCSFSTETDLDSLKSQAMAKHIPIIS